MKDFSCGSLKSIIVITLPLLLLFGVSSPGYSDKSAGHRSKTFRCENDLVSLGDSMADVVLRCGEPSYRHATGARGKARTIKRKSSTRESEDEQNNKSHSGKKKRVASKTEYEEQVMETWYYNRGPNDFVYSLHFEGGTLRKIVQGNRGK